MQPGYGNTAPFQLELNDTIVNRQDAIRNVASVIKAHFDMGGTLVNVNIVDADEILAANKNPEAYPNLIVRVTGFTAYLRHCRRSSGSWSLTGSSQINNDATRRNTPGIPPHFLSRRPSSVRAVLFFKIL